MNRRRLLISGVAATLGGMRPRSLPGVQATPGPAANPNFRVLFVRHAESEFNTLRTIDVPGNELPPDIGVTFPLTAVGMEQAVSLGNDLQSTNLLKIVTSTRLRCIQTADAIAFPHAMPVQLAPGLVEVAFTDPDASVSTIDYVAVVTAMTAWMGGTTDARAPGGESLDDLLARFLPVVEESIGAHASEAGTLVFVSHGVALSGALPFLFENVSLDWALTHFPATAGTISGAFVDGTLVCTDWDGLTPA